MRSDQLDNAVRIVATLPDPAGAGDYSLARIRQELNDKLWSAFVEPVVRSRGSYWRKQQLITLTPGRNRYKLPARACTGGVWMLEIQLPDGSFKKLSQVDGAQAQDWQGNPSIYQGLPYLYTLEGDRCELIPTPNTAAVLRITYYLRPSQLVQSQSSTQGGDGVDRGRITVVDPVLRQITVNVVPFDQLLTVPAAITSANQKIDIVSPDGWHEVVLVSSTQTLAGNVFTLPVGTDFTDIEVGQYVRVEDQTDWPCLPDDFHRMLVDITAAKILISLAQREKSDAILQNTGNDIERWKNLLTPQVRTDPPMIPLFMGGGGGWFPGRY